MRSELQSFKSEDYVLFVFNNSSVIYLLYFQYSHFILWNSPFLCPSATFSLLILHTLPLCFTFPHSCCLICSPVITSLPADWNRALLINTRQTEWWEGGRGFVVYVDYRQNLLRGWDSVSSPGSFRFLSRFRRFHLGSQSGLKRFQPADL